MSNTIKLLGISGSIRKNAFNTIILETLAAKIADQARLVIFPLNDIPLYNQDEDGDASPESVQKLRQAIADVDGVIIASPEYIYGIPGVLKNALDWVSRPHGKSTLIGKPVLTMTASPSFTGGARAQAQLNEAVTAIGGRLILRPQAIIPSVHEKIKDGKLADEATLAFLENGIADLIGEIQRIDRAA